MRLSENALLIAFVVLFVSCSPKEQPKNAPEQAKPTTSQNQTAPKTVNGKTLLKLNLQKGKSYYLRMLTDQKVTQTVMEQKTTSKEKIGVSYSYNIENVEPSGMMLIKVIYGAFSQDIEGPQGKISYNSANTADKESPFANMYSSLLNKGFKMKIDAIGKVSEITGVDLLLKGMINNMDLPPQADKKQIEMMVNQQFGDKSIREMMENLMAIYPENPVAIGDSWSRSFTLTRGFPAYFESVWTLKEIKDGKATVQLNTKIKGITLPPSKDRAPTPKYKITGEQSGTYEIDVATGWVLKSKMNQKLSGKIEIEKSEQVQKAMSFPVSIESIITTEAVK